MPDRIPVYQPLLTPRDAAAVEATVRGGWVGGTAPIVSELETRFASYCGAGGAVAAGSGTAALELALEALRIGPGDEVICPSLTIISCARAITKVGATPVLVDVARDAFGLDIERALSAVGPRTRAVLAVHLFGYPVDLEPLVALRDRGIFIVEDAAQAIGAELVVNGETYRAGAVGDASAFSFYANKAITTGEGGMVLGRDAVVVDRARRAANLFFGDDDRFRHSELGHNYRMNAMSAALGASQLERIDSIVARKREIEALYREALRDVDTLRFLEPREGTTPVPWMVAVVAAERNASELQDALSSDEIDTRPFFLGLHEQPALERVPFRAAGPFDVTEAARRHGLYLPSSLTITESEIARVAASLTNALSGGTAGRTRKRSARPFGEAYAEIYDAIYEDKAYEAEARALASLFEEESPAPVRRVLDIGCGTGRHASLLAAAGYEVTGVDASAAMLAVASRRCAKSRNVTLHRREVTELDLEGPAFDAALLMFAVLGYLGADERVQRALSAVRAQLRPGALLVADFWYGPAVLAVPPATRTRRVSVGEQDFVRTAEAVHHADEEMVTVRYAVTSSDGRVLSTESHRIRYFHPERLRSLLDEASFDTIRIADWPDLESEPSLTSYPACVLARAR